MYLLKQGDMVPSKRVDALEQRIEMLENMVKALQVKNARIGRPPKEHSNDQENIGHISDKE